MVKQINASFLCLVLTQVCLAGGITLTSHHALTNVTVVRLADQTDNSPESCQRKIDQLMDRVFGEARESKREVDTKDLERQRIETASKCVAAFSIDSVATEHLSALAKLYFQAERPAQADKAISRYLKSPQATTAGKAEILQMAIDFSIFFAKAADKSSSSERYLARLDQLGAPVIRQRMSARLRLVEHYLSVSDDAKALLHENEIANLSKALPAEAQKAALDEAIFTIDTKALFVCSTAGTARSRAIIEQTSPELIRLAHAEVWIGRILSRYLMDGQEAPQLFSRNVLNGSKSEGSGSVEKGHVTVLLFAAYWCGPCHEIYPEIKSIYRQFQDQPVRVQLVTQLSDPANDPKAPKPEEELKTIQKFYIEELKMPFPILIEGPVDKPSGDKQVDELKASRQWRLFSFYPMMLVIDKKGRTRAILIGTLPGQGERLRTKVEELLKEPA